MTSTLPAAPDLSAFGGVGPSIESISAATRNSLSIGTEEMDALNNNLKNKVGGATSYIDDTALPAVNLPKVDLGGSRIIKNDLTGRWEQFN